MGRLIKILVLATLVLAAAGAVSFAGAFMKMKGYLGDDLPALGPRQSSFVPKAEELEGDPMVWKFQYPRTEIQGLRSITIFISLNGTVKGTIPANLNARLEPHRERMP